MQPSSFGLVRLLETIADLLPLIWWKREITKLCAVIIIKHKVSRA